MLFALHIFAYKGVDKSPIIISSAVDFNKLWFFQRGIAKDHANHNARIVVMKSKPGCKMSIELEGKQFICYVINNPNGLCATMIATKSYPEKYGIIALNECLNEFTQLAKSDLGKLLASSKDAQYKADFINKQLEKWQEPEKNDKLLLIQKNLDMLKEIMRKNLEDLVGNQELLDDMLIKSKDLSSISIDFYQKAKKNNQCCKYV
jgi:synaptobrevin family protein YKT6